MSNSVAKEWFSLPMKELFSFQRGNITPSEYPDEKFNYYSLPAFDEFGDSIYAYGGQIDSSKTLLTEPTLLVSKLNPRKPRVIISDKFNGLRSCASTEFMAYVSTSSKTLHLPFYKWYLGSEYFHSKLELVATGSTNSHVRVSPKETLLWQVPFPPLLEQKKIAAIFTSVDDVIEKTQAQIYKLKDLKTGMMQELLTRGVGVDGKPHTEFKDSPVGRIPNGWEVQNFSSVTLKIQDGTHFSPKSKDGERLYITSKNIQKGKLLLTNVSYISQEEHDEIYKRCDVKYGDVLLTKDGANTGNCAMNTLHEPFSLLSSVAFLRCDESICLNHYLYQYMSSSMFRRDVKDSMTGNAITRLTLTIIKSLKVPVPPIEEQEKIVKMLSGIDECMSIKQQKLESLKNTKKALMQDLFTGKVRVKVGS